MVAVAALPRIEAPLLFRTKDGTIATWASPSNIWELWEYAWKYFGLRFAPPDAPHCAGHTLPIQFLWDCYSGKVSIAVLKGSRGLAGKSVLLSLLAALKLLDGADTTVLGGSLQQSQRVHESLNDIWDHEVVVAEGEGEPLGVIEKPFRRYLDGDTALATKMDDGAWLRVLTASTKSARGPHPQVLLLDEVDEMDIVVLNAALGQTMEDSRNTLALVAREMALTVFSSTHHYPDKAFTEVLKRAEERGWPVYEVCYRENLIEHGGWLKPSEIERKKNEVTQIMWDTEYELQEPSSEGRAFDTDSVLVAFDPALGTIDDQVHRAYLFQKAVPGGSYATGADWARTTDFTVITTVRYDRRVDKKGDAIPAQVVAFERTRRRPWPEMIGRFNRRLEMYPGRASHDATGIGDVVSDFIEEDAYAMKMVGEARHSLFTDYVKAVESHEVRSPLIRSMKADHLYCLAADLYGTAANNHPPDSVVAMAQTWLAVKGKNRKPGAKTPGRPLRVRSIG